MAEHDFAVLSSYEFEKLTRDLLQAEWNVTLESFPPGPDSGIDLRHIDASGQVSIIQCKHYSGSAFPALLRNLKKELPKVEKLKPHRYVISTSLPLTPPNKKAILQVFHPFIRSQKDIIGRNDIEGLLKRHRDVERDHYKLWLTSTRVLREIVNIGVRNETDAKIDDIRRTLRNLVQTAAYPAAKQILEQDRLITISGPPGVGKSTLGDLLFVASIEGGLAPVYSRTVEDGYRLFDRSAKQVFLFDDFLGKTYLGDQEWFRKANGDGAFVRFVNMVLSTKDSRIILTTREHILRVAIQISEQLNRGPIPLARYHMKLRGYSRDESAQILFQHLYFRALNAPDLAEFVHSRTYFSLIDHSNFSPRLVQWLATPTSISGESFSEQALHLFDQPHEYWRHAFDQISPSGRRLLIALGSSRGMDLESIRTVFTALSGIQSDELKHSDRFEVALEELDGTFVEVLDTTVAYLNPSVKDFLEHVLYCNETIFSKVVSCAVSLKQICTVLLIGVHTYPDNLRKLLQALHLTLAKSLSRLVEEDEEPLSVWDVSLLIRLAGEHRLRRLAPTIHRLLNLLISQDQCGTTHLVLLLKDLSKFDWLLLGDSTLLHPRLIRLALNSWRTIGARDWIDIYDLSSGAPWTPMDRKKVIAGIRYYHDQGGMIESPGHSPPERHRHAEYLENLSKRSGCDFRSAIAALRAVPIEESEWRPTDFSLLDDDSFDITADYNTSRDSQSGALSDDDIEQMFRRLLESEPQ